MEIFEECRDVFGMQGNSERIELMKSVVCVFRDLQIFEVFQNELLERCGRDYEELADSLLRQQLTIFGFVEKAQAIQAREYELITTLLPQTSHEIFFQKFYKTFLAHSLPLLVADKTKLWTLFFSSKENTHRNFLNLYNASKNF
jgi:hypothetical protein